MFKVLSIFGTRPEAIKLAPVIGELQHRSHLFQTVVAVTGQHREMLDQMLRFFDIEPAYDLNIMTRNQNLFDLTARVLKGVETVLNREQPAIVLVQGDTTTTFVATLASYYMKIPIGHVEAGLRTHDKYNPFPEEINRRLVSSLADFHFAPTERARRNLLGEGIPSERIYLTGNTVIDALLSVVNTSYSFDEHPVLRDIDFCEKKVLTVTIHRRESFGNPIRSMFLALDEIVTANSDVEVVYPVHLNPKVQGMAKRILDNKDRIHLIEPLPYVPFVHLMDKSYLILTDSGGIQEEAPSLGKPVLVLRETTERPEAIEAGTARLVGTSREQIVVEVQNLLDNRSEYEQMVRSLNPYGDGKAAQRIADVLESVLQS